MIFSDLARAAAAAALVAALAIAPLPALQSAAMAQEGGADDGDEVVATVNGAEIRYSDLIIAEEEIGPDLAKLPDEYRFQVLLGMLIDRQVLATAARKDNLQDDPAVQRRIRYYTDKALEDVYFQRQLEDSLTDDEVRAYYDEQVAAMSSEELRTRHILLETEEAALEARAAIEGGEAFEEVAKARSTGPSADAGGDLGYITREQVVPEFGDAIYALEVGEVSQPVQTKFGWHIIKVEDRRATTPPPFEDVASSIRSLLLERKGDELVKELRDAADIVIPGAQQSRPQLMPE